jgi:hypothetical protein
MSLASRVSNLFAGSLPAPSGEQERFGFKDDGLSDERIAFADTDRAYPHSASMAVKDVVDEEGRPPYLYVSPI